MMFQKKKPWRNDQYLKWIREQPCMICGTPSEAHHLIGTGDMSGMGMKAPDYATMPLCRLCHTDMHNKPELWRYQFGMIVRTIGAAIDAGKLQWRK